MSKAKRAMGGFQLELGSDHDMKSYNISQQGNELKLRAFLFRDGVLYKDGAQITSIDPQDLDEETKKCVGRGASGSVYFVLHKRTREPLALKEIIITTKPRRDEVSAELAVLAEGIHNPHIIRHFGAYWSAESHSIALVMEWMAYSLEDMTKMLGQLDAHVIKNLAVQLVAGLRFLHDEKRVIHRDIKPSNILINSAGEVKYGDFGISKVVKTVQNISNTFVGTQLFMAPERLEEGEYSFVSDVWSLGLTLICCATGKRPWTDDQDTADVEEGGRNPAQLFQMLQRMASGAVPEFPANFPEAAHDFAKRCLERDPAKRATAAELSTHPFVAGVSEEESRQELSGLLAFASKLACRAAESQTV